MNSIEFENQVEWRISKIRELFVVKAREYIEDNDNRFHNFLSASRVSMESPERVLHMYFLKHFISYMDMLDGIDKGKTYDPDYVREKMGDIIAYMILQEAQLLERFDTVGVPKRESALTRVFNQIKQFIKQKRNRNDNIINQ